MPDARLLLRDLTEHATQRKYAHSHRWRVGDLVIWDNRCTMHRATPFEDGRFKRELRRVTTLDIEASKRNSHRKTLRSIGAVIRDDRRYLRTRSDNDRITLAACRTGYRALRCARNERRLVARRKAVQYREYWLDEQRRMRSFWAQPEGTRRFSRRALSAALAVLLDIGCVVLLALHEAHSRRSREIQSLTGC